MSVTLINPFHLTAVDEFAFVHKWKQTASVFAARSGYLDTKLHQSIDPKARFRFVNVAHWETAEAWSEAMKSFPPAEGATPGVEANAALYTAVAGGSPAPAHQTVAQELQEQETALAEAYRTHDLASLRRVLADDYLVTDGPGTVSDKAKVIDDHEKRRLQVSTFHFDEVQIQPLTADVAIARGQYTWSANYDGHSISGAFRYLRVWVRNEQGWLLKAGQVTPVLHNPK